MPNILTDKSEQAFVTKTASSGTLIVSESEAEASDFFALLKPRVMTLVIFTALAGMLIALTSENHLHPILGFASLLAIAVGAGASGALNMWYDADIDAIMSRTKLRPIPAGKITPDTAAGFGLFLSAFSVLVLGLVSNWLAASLLAFTIFFYVVIYTMWLKRLTPQNIVIGGAAGALPPMIGYAVVTNTITLQSFSLFLLIFLWTPPHFWALALVKFEDYAKANVPMMPNSKGFARTRLEILLYTLILLPAGFLPLFLGVGGTLYLLVAVLMSMFMLRSAILVFSLTDSALLEPFGRKRCWSLFAISILYLFMLFAALVFERLLSLWGLCDVSLAVISPFLSFMTGH